MAFATLILSLASMPINYYINLPFYAKAFGLSMDAVIGMSAKVNPLVKDPMTLLLFVFFAFNMFKGIVVSVITFFVYKPISKLINRTYDKTHASKGQKA